MNKTEQVSSGTFEVGYTIYRYDDGTYDWALDNGDESDEFFGTEQEAYEDVRSRFT